MAGNKRAWDGTMVSRELNEENMESESPTSAYNFQSIFGEFRNELDEHHDRRERVVKASRDITALSKKIIFSLQRVRTLNNPLPTHIANETDQRLNQIRDLFNSIVPDVTGINAWRYQYQVSWGIQEYIEALSFKYYIENKKLIPFEDVSKSIPSEILITETDYVLGLFDLTGEMMRFAITSMTAGGHVGVTDTSVNKDTAGGSGEDEQSKTPVRGDAVVSDLRQLRAMFERLEVPRGHSLGKELPKKMEVMQTSVEKVERAVYGFLVRGKERPAGWAPDVSSAAPVESY